MVDRLLPRGATSFKVEKSTGSLIRIVVPLFDLKVSVDPNQFIKIPGKGIKKRPHQTTKEQYVDWKDRDSRQFPDKTDYDAGEETVTQFAIHDASLALIEKYGLDPKPILSNRSVLSQPFRTIGDTSRELMELNCKLNPPDPYRAARQFGRMFPHLDNMEFGL